MLIRNWERTLLGAVTVAAFAGYVAYATLTDARAGTAGADTVGGAIVEALLLVLLVRIWRAGALVTGDRLVVRNVLRSWSLPWSEVAAFSPADDDPRHHMIGVTTTDGRRVACASLRSPAGWGLVGPPAYAEYAARSPAANRLAAEVDRHTAARPGIAPPTDSGRGA